ncbi:MAG TPA: polysaccharide biosynthesis tyrosine autokinase [Rhizomicrobium sp.]
MSFQGINPTPASPLDARPQAAFELADIMSLLRAKTGLILRVAAVTVALAVVAVSLLPTRYSSSAIVMLDNRKNAIADLSAVLSALPTDPASLQNQIQVLQSRDLAADVIAKLKLYDDPEFNGALQPSVGGALLATLNPRNWFAGDPGPPDPAVERDAIIDAFLSHLSAATVGLSTTITVTFISRDRDKAALIANAVAQTYVESLVATKLKASEATSAWLTARLRELGGQVQAQEAAALTYRAQHNLDSSAGGTALIEQQLGGINGQIIQARADLSAKLAVYNQVQTLLKAGRPADISQIIASPLIIQLRGQQAELLRQQSALAIPYGPRHPKRIAIENQVKDLDLKIGEEASRVATGLANDVEVARAQLGSLQGSLSSTQHQASGQDMIAVKLKALEAEAASSRKLYESFLGRLRGIQDQDGLLVPDAHLISHAAVASGPSWPPRLLIVLASIPAGLLLGCLAALLSVRFPSRRPVAVRPRPRPMPQPLPRPVPAMAAPPLLAEIPGVQNAGAADHVIDWPASPFARAVTALLGRVAPSPGTGRVVSITASAHDASGTTVALALARAASKAGLRTILVDGHVLQPALVRLTGIHPQGGLMEVLGQSTTVNRALTRDPRSAALLLGTLRAPRDPAAALASPRMAELFAHLRAICDLVIVTAPPVAVSREAPTFARLSDAVVLVTRPEEAPHPHVGQALSTLAQWRSAPVGMVLVH